MIRALAWMEQTPLSVFVREDFYAYFVLLIGHAWGMALLVGGGLAFSLRMLGLAAGTDIAAWRKLVPVMKLGAVLAIVSGLGLLAGYPAKALTNWVFAAKFVCLIGAGWLVAVMLRRTAHLSGQPDTATRIGAALAVVLWIGGVAAGKLLLYTNVMLTTAEVLP